MSSTVNRDVPSLQFLRLNTSSWLILRWKELCTQCLCKAYWIVMTKTPDKSQELQKGEEARREKDVLSLGGAKT